MNAKVKGGGVAPSEETAVQSYHHASDRGVHLQEPLKRYVQLQDWLRKSLHWQVRTVPSLFRLQ
eukprot:5910784-Amphidinium_carterae.1